MEPLTTRSSLGGHGQPCVSGTTPTKTGNTDIHVEAVMTAVAPLNRAPLIMLKSTPKSLTSHVYINIYQTLGFSTWKRGYVGGASVSVEDDYAIELGGPENRGVGVGITSLGALEAEIPLGGIFTPPVG